MITSIIVDDESYMRDNIRLRIKQNFNLDIEVLGEAATVKEAVIKINTLKPKLLFLDINLSDGTGFDILDKVTHNDFKVIFITGYDNHAIKAIKIGALDYIVKPIDDDEFDSAIGKLISTIKKEVTIKKQYQISSNFYSNTENNKIVLKTLDTQYVISFEEIIYCNSEGNYTTFFLENEKITISKSIKKVEELLSDTVFIKCHQSYLVNRKHIKKYINSGYLITKYNNEIPVSTRRKEFVLSELF